MVTRSGVAHSNMGAQVVEQQGSNSASVERRSSTFWAGKARCQRAHRQPRRSGNKLVVRCANPCSVDVQKELQSSALPCPAKEPEASPEVPVARKCVKFDLEAKTEHFVAPYAEIYGLHPRLFDFDRNFWMVPATGFPNMAAFSRGDESDEDSDSDEGEWEEWQPKAFLASI